MVHELGRVEERARRAEARREHIVVVLCRTEAAALVLVEFGEAAANGDAEIPGHDEASSARVAWSNSAMISSASMPGWVGTAASRTERRDRAIVVGSKPRICPRRCPSSNRATRSATASADRSREDGSCEADGTCGPWCVPPQCTGG